MAREGERERGKQRKRGRDIEKLNSKDGKRERRIKGNRVYIERRRKRERQTETEKE